MASPARKTVCVTGASGYIASQLVKQLLEAGYSVRGTVRSLSNAKKTEHLRALPGAERLELFEADLLADGSFDEAVSSCEGVFHTASPFFFKGVTDPEAQLLQPALQGTRNVLSSCSKAASVTRVVLTSSMAAVGVNGNTLPKDHVYSEADWSKEDVMREKGIWYPLSKTIAERAAWDFVKQQSQFDLVVINPCLVAGPILQPTLNTSSEMVLAYLDGSKDKIGNSAMGFVDVRDVAHTHILAMEKPEAEGRYVCESTSALWKDVAGVLRELAPDAAVPTAVEDGEPATPTKFTNAKATQLGVTFRPLRDILEGTVQGLKDRGFYPTSTA